METNAFPPGIAAVSSPLKVFQMKIGFALFRKLFDEDTARRRRASTPFTS